MTHDSNTELVEAAVKAGAARDLLHRIIEQLDASEVHILLVGVASQRTTNVPQAILRDGMNRERLK